MPAPLSIVIPTLNAAPLLAASTASLMEGVEMGLVRELVLSDGGSTDETAKAAKELGAVWVSGPASRGGQLARGAKAASAPWLLFLHADTWLAPGWAEVALTHMNASPDMAATFRLAFRSEAGAARRVAAWANWRTRMLGLPYGDQGLLISHELYDQVGGHPDQPLMEDVALAKALKGRLAVLPVEARTSAIRYETEGWIKRGGRNLFTLLRYRMGADPAQLAKRYHSSN
ncbi:TIGR04283 family arsenosugar biosynthesis glycosyltransferase [Nioella aestuarii]|uniref:TIGR04283 family arsenosugar biosynthesis glycosyltransferase n=1 Tax=Nioella aestuarii TaxID=1662864 RepID=UPI003D7FD111